MKNASSRMFNTTFLMSAMLAGALVSSSVLADDHGDHEADTAKHFAAKPSPDVNTALCHLATYNKLLSDVTSAQSVDPVAMNQVHELTYTLENALARLHQTLAATAAALEEVHLASERMDETVVKQQTQMYLSLLTSLQSQCK